MIFVAVCWVFTTIHWAEDFAYMIFFRSFCTGLWRASIISLIFAEEWYEAQGHTAMPNLGAGEQLNFRIWFSGSDSSDLQENKTHIYPGK